MLNEEQFRRIQLIVFIDYACFFFGIFFKCSLKNNQQF